MTSNDFTYIPRDLQKYKIETKYMLQYLLHCKSLVQNVLIIVANKNMEFTI